MRADRPSACWQGRYARSCHPRPIRELEEALLVILKRYLLREMMVIERDIRAMDAKARGHLAGFEDVDVAGIALGADTILRLRLPAPRAMPATSTSSKPAR